MARRHRVLPSDIPTHLVQRAVDRRVLFADPSDFRLFLDVLIEATTRHPVQLLGYCVMPNHWHLLATSGMPAGISRYMQWLTSTHAFRHRRSRGTIGNGHVYQGRFWSAPIESERHFFTVLRYIETNALRAGLVTRAEEWRWSSAWERMTGNNGLLSPLPTRLPDNWNACLNELHPIDRDE